jgi:hypothetical protein
LKRFVGMFGEVDDATLSYMRRKHDRKVLNI